MRRSSLNQHARSPPVRANVKQRSTGVIGIKTGEGRMANTISYGFEPRSQKDAALARERQRGRFGRTAIPALFCIGVACVAVAGPAAARSARDAFDGDWSVVITTQSGACDPSFRYGLRISNGQVLNNGSSNVDVQGRVTPKGMVRVDVQGGGQWASGTGRLDLTRGSGVWQGQGNAGDCTGTWAAQRGGAQSAGAEEPSGPLYNFAPGQPPVAVQPAQSAVQSAVAACAARFHSYDAASGTYLGIDGQRHPCP
jgi:hypothetical protein